jgi:hypothetical protein
MANSITSCPSANCVNARSGGIDLDAWLGLNPAGHLFNELTWLLRAAQEWQVQSDLALELKGYGTQVYAMDAVFLHARPLFEFFLGNGRNYCHAQCFFGLDSQLEYELYADGTGDPKLWANMLHVGSMHLQNRTAVNKVVDIDGTEKDLKEMPPDFAKGMVELWERFEAALSAKGLSTALTLATECRKQAIKDANAVVDSVAARAKTYSTKVTPTLAVTRLF